MGVERDMCEFPAILTAVGPCRSRPRSTGHAPPPPGRTYTRKRCASSPPGSPFERLPWRSGSAPPSPDPAARHLLRFLVGHGGLSGAAAISTCNRTELYVSIHDEPDPEAVIPRLRRYLDPEGEEPVREHVRIFRGEEAVAHLFRGGRRAATRWWSARPRSSARSRPRIVSPWRRGASTRSSTSSSGGPSAPPSWPAPRPGSAALPAASARRRSRWPRGCWAAWRAAPRWSSVPAR